MLLSFNSKIWLYRKPVDFRMQIDGLVLLVSGYLAQDPTSGHIFAFRNSSANKIKLLYWEDNGFWLLYKRLEKGKLKFPSAEDSQYEITKDELQWLLSGFDITQLHKNSSLKVTNFY
jgi:transposase